MSKRKTITAFLTAAAMFLIILDGQTAVSAASEAIGLCIRSVIPALFPFFVLSTLLTGSILGSQIPFMKIVCRVFRIPQGSESLVIAGFLGGYPVGAQCVANAWKKGQLSRTDAERMLAFCSNAGPSFIFGLLGPILSLRKAWLLWGIHILSSLAVALLIPARPGTMGEMKGSPVTLSEAVHRSLRNMAAVCGWIILFRICIGFLNRWFLWLLPQQWVVALMGFLELTNGCLALDTLSDEGLRCILCAAMLGFGGICVTMQTLSVTQGLTLRFYLLGKIMQSACSTLLICLIYPGYPHIFWSAVGILLFTALSLRKSEKRSRNQTAIGV